MTDGIAAPLLRATHKLDARFCLLHQAAIHGKIIERHAACREAGLELFADGGPVQRRKAIDHRDGAGFIFHHETGEADVDDLRDRSPVIGEDRRTAGHRLDHDEAERLGPINRNQQADCAAEEVRLLAIRDLADEFDQRTGLDERCNQLVVLLLIGAIDLCRNLQRNAASSGNADGAIDALFRRDPSKHGQV